MTPTEWTYFGLSFSLLRYSLYMNDQMYKWTFSTSSSPAACNPTSSKG